MKTLKTIIVLAVFALMPLASAHAELGWNEYAPFEYVGGGDLPHNMTSSSNPSSTASTGHVASASTSTPTTPVAHPYVAPKPTPKPVVTTASVTKDESCGSDEFKTVNPDLQTASVGSIGGDFLPNSFMEWFVIIVLVFAIVFFARYLYSEREKQMQTA